jgi:hypothetical protein
MPLERLLNNEPGMPVGNKSAPVRVRTTEMAQLYRHFGIRPDWEEGQVQGGVRFKQCRNVGHRLRKPPMTGIPQLTHECN